MKENTLSPRSLFLLSIAGFSFWFFLAVPMPSHRESYMWLSRMRDGNTMLDFVTMSVATYRPISQALMWFVYEYLGFDNMPSNGTRQVIVQGLVYVSFVFGWWLMFKAASQRRSFAILGLVSGGVLFPPYIQLFHPWGMFYSPVVATVGFLVLLSTQDKTKPSQLLALLAFAAALVFWHPFASALIVAYLIGEALDKIAHQKSSPAIAWAVALGLLGALVLMGQSLSLVKDHALFERIDGLLVSYKTIEVNSVAAAVSVFLSMATAWSLPMGRNLRGVAAASALVLAGLCVLYEMPVILVWLALALVKALALGRWRLAALLSAAALLPLGSGIGSPIYGLFAIMTAVYISALDQFWLERALSPVSPSAVWVFVAMIIGLSLAQRWLDIPGMDRLVAPLLAEKERSQQLEQGLFWLRQSSYCGADVAFIESAGFPKLSTQNVIKRDHRPPSKIEHVRQFWRTYRCGKVDGQSVIFTFGDQVVPDAKLLTELPSRHAGRMQVFWRP